MSKLFDQFQDMPLWAEASSLMLDINDAVTGSTHPLAIKTLELAANLPTQLAYAGTNPNANIMDEIATTLNRAIALEHHLKMINVQRPAKALNAFKALLIQLIEDELNGEFDDE